MRSVCRTRATVTKLIRSLPLGHSVNARPPHPATVVQRKPAMAAPNARPPHPATVGAGPGARAPRAAPTVAQRSSKEREENTPPPPPPPMVFAERPRGEAEFATALVAGRRRLQTLLAGPQDYINPGPSQQTWARYAQYYQHAPIDDLGPGKVGITSIFKQRDAGDERYENYFDFNIGEITASHNVRSKKEDQTLAHSLTGSEVIFRQIVFVEDFLGRTFLLRTLKRKSVINPAAQALIFYLRKLGGTNEVRFLPDSNGFLALLGTANGTAATYLVHDHGFYLGVQGVRSATITQQGHIVFEFVPGRYGR
jgi:hypothetical protein